MSEMSISPRKRPHPDSEVGEPAQEETACTVSQPGDGVNALGYPELQESIEVASHRCSSETSRLTSPPLSSNGSNIGESAVSSAQVQHATPTQPAKRRKLTFAEKESLKNEKELKDKQKAEEKAKKEDEKRVKEAEKKRKEEEAKEEKRKKEEEREEKKRIKDLEKSTKEEEKRRKEEEKVKKEKSQMRLNSFFVKPVTTSPGLVSTPPAERRNPMDGRRSSLGSIDGMDMSTGSRSTSASPQKITESDYERLFPHFYLQSHTVLAPYNRFSRDVQALELARAGIDAHLRSAWTGLEEVLGKRKVLQTYAIEQLHIPQHKRKKRARIQPTVKSIMERINGTEENPIDLTDGEKPRKYNPVELLRSLSVKHLQFAEDVRPPYRGTYTKLPTKQSPLSLARNPFDQALPHTNYDYDSEAEWEEPGEGEDLDSEGEEEHGSDDEEDEMEGFLDDDDTGDGVPTAGNKRRHVVGNLEPVSSGLCWEDCHGRSRGGTDGRVDSKMDLKTYRLEFMLEHHSLPIDPFSTAYWACNDTSSIPPSTDAAASKATTASLMNPPRIPLHAINRTNPAINGLAPSALTLVNSDGKIVSNPPDLATPSKAQKPASKRQVAPELMSDFKRAIQGSDLTKAGLIEILKKQFPKTSKDAIKDTLTTIADRVGTKEVDKRWVIREGV